MDPGVDTALDSLAAQVRTRPPLPLEEVADLLGRVHREGAGEASTTLVEHHLGVALDAALARAESGVDVGDLYQEASIAVVTAVGEYAARSGDAVGLRGYVRRVVDLFVDAAVEREEAERRTAEALVSDSRLLDLAEVEMRKQLGREATALELAALLGWPLERVSVIGDLLAEARARNDASLVPFLDDLDGLEELDDDGDTGAEEDRRQA
jgi:DNA-directed RNA polymerase sigma subunit (sigma70/sigma32)